MNYSKRLQKSDSVSFFRWFKGFPAKFLPVFCWCHCREALVVKKMKIFVRR